MSLFNRPAWAKQQLSDDDDDRSEANLFSHSHSYNDIVADQERRRKEKEEKKKKAKAERRSSGKREVKDEPNGDTSPKRRRITSDESEKLLKSVGLPARLERGRDEDNHSAAEDTPVRRSPRKQKQRAQGAQPPRRADVIDLGGSSDEAEDGGIQTTPGGWRAKPSAPVDEVKEDSDDEFAELARKARQQRQQTNNRSSRTPIPGVASPSPGIGPSHRTNHDRPPDPTIQLLITSPLPGTNPLIVHRKLSQRTAEIRHAWCQKQGFSKEYADGVFFVHRMRRVYDVTTCRSLGLDVDEYGNVTMRGAEGKEDVDKVHLEAVTDEVFKQMKEAKDREVQAADGEDATEGAEEEQAAPAAKEESLIRLVLKAKGQSDFKLKVKASTPISRIAAAYAKSALRDTSRQVRLEFDGEDLNPDETVQDTEIEDMNVIDVHMI